MRQFPVPANAASAADEAPALSIGPSVTIVGAVHVDGPVHLDGVVQGEVRCQRLTVSERGSVEGLIVADWVAIAGDVNGAVYANSLVLKSRCSVEGEIFHSSLDLEEGCVFEGKSRRYSRPLGLAPPMDQAAE